MPNYLTLLRIALIPFFFTQLVSYQPGQEKRRAVALTILIIACLSDALDGFLARALNQKTELGCFLDPLADKLLVLSGFLGLLFVKTLPYTPPLWITVTIVFRDLIIALGLVIMFLMNGKVEVRPNFLGKLTTASQMITLCSILLGWKLSIVLWYLTVTFTILSCFSYVVRDIKEIQR